MSHSSKVMLRIILSRLRPQAKNIIAEEQADFLKGSSTTAQIFNVCILCQKLQHQRVIPRLRRFQESVWHDVLWVTMKKFNIGKKPIHPPRAVRQRSVCPGYCREVFPHFCRSPSRLPPSPTLFSIFVKRSISDGLEVRIGGRTIMNLTYTDDIGRLRERVN